MNTGNVKHVFYVCRINIKSSCVHILKNEKKNPEWEFHILSNITDFLKVLSWSLHSYKVICKKAVFSPLRRQNCLIYPVLFNLLCILKLPAGQQQNFFYSLFPGISSGIKFVAEELSIRASQHPI